MHEPLEATLRRLKAERDDADQRYNEALTALVCEEALRSAMQPTCQLASRKPGFLALRR